MLGNINVAAVVVTYEPNKNAVLNLISALVGQVEYFIIIDNGSSNNWVVDLRIKILYPKIFIVSLSVNEGIAYAQNRGVELGISLGASHILFSDQDSIPKSDMVSRLLLALTAYQSIANTMPVAAISPATVDGRTKRVSEFVLNTTSSSMEILNDNGVKSIPLVHVSFLISSGMFVPIDAIHAIAGFQSAYFIDHVDTEWCFRARSKGFCLLGLKEPLLEHALGDRVQKVWFLRERHVSIHSALRDYYMARNTCAMIKSGNLSLSWCLHFVWRMVQLFIFYLIFTDSRLDHLKMIIKGTWHGLRGLNGRLNPKTNCLEAISKTQLDP